MPKIEIMETRLSHNNRLVSEIDLLNERLSKEKLHVHSAFG